LHDCTDAAVGFSALLRHDRIKKKAPPKSGAAMKRMEKLLLDSKKSNTKDNKNCLFDQKK